MQAPVRCFDGLLGDKQLAKHLLNERNRLRTTILDLAAPADEQTVLLDVLSDSLIDRFTEALVDAAWTPLLSWAEATCMADRPQIAGIRRIFTSIGPALRQTFEVQGLDEIDRRLSTVVRKAQSQQPERSETIDELDILLADMLFRIETRDTKTAEHCRAVSAWCARIANRMQMTRAETTFVARGGLIHDVGKSASPVEILQAPRALTDEETAVMRQHVLIGDEMVRSYTKLTDYAGMVRSHHERYDGAGYPDSLDRTRIPVNVRIVSVADSFNAMIGRRPYRAPFSPSRAAAELQRHMGSQFDPEVVTALLDVITSKSDAVDAVPEQPNVGTISSEHDAAIENVTATP